MTIKPTIGRVVLFWPAVAPGGTQRAQPQPALVSYVWNDRLINIGGFDGNGAPFAATSVLLLQDDDVPPAGYYAEWMPYQKTQAEKHAATEAAAAPAPVGGPVTDAELPNHGKRVRPADLEAEIEHEDYINAGAATRIAGGPLSLLTLCVLTLRNGFTVVGKSACASAENYDKAIGERIARADAVDQLWPLMGFRLRDQLAQAKRA